MKFSEWLEKNHPESLDEVSLRNTMLALGAAGALAAGASGLIGKSERGAYQNRSTIADEFDDEVSSVEAQEKKLRDAAQKVGIPKSQWNNLRGTMIGGVVTVVNGKKVPLTPEEAENVKFAQELGRRMGN